MARHPDRSRRACTNRAARACVHVALATGADQILAKPGMGVDEGLSIVSNEMARTLRLESVWAQTP